MGATMSSSDAWVIRLTGAVETCGPYVTFRSWHHLLSCSGNAETGRLICDADASAIVAKVDGCYDGSAADFCRALKWCEIFGGNAAEVFALSDFELCVAADCCGPNETDDRLVLERPKETQLLVHCCGACTHLVAPGHPRNCFAMVDRSESTHLASRRDEETGMGTPSVGACNCLGSGCQ